MTFFNEFAQHFLGYTEGEILGQSAGALVPETESIGRDLKALIGEILQNPERYVENESENIKRNGERVWLHSAMMQRVFQELQSQAPDRQV